MSDHTESKELAILASPARRTTVALFIQAAPCCAGLGNDPIGATDERVIQVAFEVEKQLAVAHRPAGLDLCSAVRVI